NEFPHSALLDSVIVTESNCKGAPSGYPLRLQPLEDARRALSAADAHCHHAIARVAPPQLVQQLDGQLGAGAAERVTKRDRAAIDVDARRVEVQLANDSQRLRGERLVQFDQVEIALRQPGALED